MENLKKSSTKSSPVELNTMIGLVATHYREADPEELAGLVSREFEIDCTIEDVVEYYAQQSSIREDFELESRRHEYKHYY